MKRHLVWAGLLFLVGYSVLAAQPSDDWLRLIQTPHLKKPLPDLGLQPLLRAGDTKKQWATRRESLRQRWQARLGRPIAKPAKLDVQVHKTEKRRGHTRKLISFHSGGGDRLRAWLLIPNGLRANEKRPAVVVFHSTTKSTLNQPVSDGPLGLANQLVARGYVVLAPECFIMKGGGPRAQAKAIAQRWPQWTGLGKMTFDASRCVDFLESLSFVDGAKIGCIGHSLGAKEVLFAMAFESRYRAGVFNEGGVGLRMSNWTDPWYLTLTMKKHIPALENHQVLALIAPRPILIMGGDSADGAASWPFVHAVLPVYRLLEARDQVGLFNHKAKHTFPQPARQLAFRWLDRGLQFRLPR